MYRRYTSMDRQGVNPSRFKQTLIRDIIIALLLAGLIVLAIFAIPAMKDQEKEKSITIRNMISEYSEANRGVIALSSYGKETSEAEIRCHLYAIKSLNNLYQAQNGQFLVSDDVLTQCIGYVDDYIRDSAGKGSNLTIIMSDLRSAMDELNNELSRYN